MKLKKLAALITFFVLSASTGKVVAGCPTKGVKELTGAGATFPYPLYSKMFSEYDKICGVKVNYQSIGSGGGIRQLSEMTVDFGASDGIMDENQKAGAKGGAVLHVPTVAGATAVVINLAGIKSGQLQLTPDILADLYLKKITNWNDKRIAAANPGVKLPDLAVAVVHRSDGSGTTFIFTDYLSKVSGEWKTKVGSATSVNWPGDVGGKGNEGVANSVKQIPGAIGYVEVAYAKQNKIPWAQIQNKSKKFLEPSLEGAEAAADVPTLPNNMEVMITDSSNPNGYPITGFTWLLLYENQADSAKGDAIAQLASWMIGDGQKYAPPLEYAPLKGAAKQKAMTLVKKIKANGALVLK